MLREKQIETKIVEAIAALEPLAGAQVVGSRSVVAIEESGAPVFVAVALGLRQHDNFTLPTVNMAGVVSITTRSEPSSRQSRSFSPAGTWTPRR